MARLIRMMSDLQQGNGDFIFHFDGNPQYINRTSAVWATISEVNPNNGVKFIGAARMSVRNVAPRDDGIIDLWIQIEWPTPLFYIVNLLATDVFGVIDLIEGPAAGPGDPRT